MYQTITSLLQPYPLLLLLLGLAIANLWRKRRETRRRLLVLTALFVTLTLLSTPAVGHLALGTLEGRFPPLEQRPADAEAIVVLADGVNLPDEPGGPAEPDSGTMHRCRHAAELYQRGAACPVLLSGGKVDADVPEVTFAEVMRTYLLQLGVRDADVIMEATSRNTYENAVESRKLLERHNIRKVVLVTDAVHMNRARACFRKQGLEVVAAPCHYQASRLEGSLRDLFPNPDAVTDCRDAAHEWLGTLWYRLRGWL
jgi:uncharacterized SAM-binding protein YcdF (DUF218 family)